MIIFETKPPNWVRVEARSKKFVSLMLIHASRAENLTRATSNNSIDTLSSSEQHKSIQPENTSDGRYQRSRSPSAESVYYEAEDMVQFDGTAEDPAFTGNRHEKDIITRVESQNKPQELSTKRIKECLTLGLNDRSQEANILSVAWNSTVGNEMPVDAVYDLW